MTAAAYLGKVRHGNFFAPSPAAEIPRKTVTITLVGDILLASRVGTLAKEKGVPHLFEGVKSYLTKDDLTIGNLESAVATRGKAEDKKYTFRARPEVLPGLKSSGIDMVSLANNHAMDFGRKALVQTLEELDKADIPYAGAGRNADQAARPVIVEVKSTRIALVAASRVLPSTSWRAGKRRAGIAQAYSYDDLLASIRAARNSADIVIAYLHWGVEKSPTPEEYQRTLGKACIDAGADLVIGAHPHVLQGFEFHQGKLIAYSLGNFVFTDAAKPTAMLQATFEAGKSPVFQVIPCKITRYRPAAVTKPASIQKALQSLRDISYQATIDADGRITDKKR